MNGAQVVLKALQNEGVEVIFGHPGGAIMPIYDALYDFPKLQTRARTSRAGGCPRRRRLLPGER